MIQNAANLFLVIGPLTLARTKKVNFRYANQFGGERLSNNNSIGYQNLNYYEIRAFRFNQL